MEKRQLLATFDYNSGTGLLTVVTNQNSETLSIVSTSNAGNYTIATTGTWSGTSSVDVGNSGRNLFVNSTANINLIQISSNAVNSGSAFYFGVSTGNFVDNLTVNFSNATSGSITVANATSFINGSNLNLTTTGNQITVSGPLKANSTGSISLTGRNIAVTRNINTAAGGISLIGNNGAYQAGTFVGVCISGSAVNVNTTGGDIMIDGRAGGGSANQGVTIASAKIQAGGLGNISITGVSGNGTGTKAYGLSVTNGTISTLNGNIILSGTACSTDDDSHGVDLRNPNIVAGGTGNISITGNVAVGGRYSYGILTEQGSITGGNITTNNGSITLSGISNGTDAGTARGLYLLNDHWIIAGGSGSIYLSGMTTIPNPHAVDLAQIHLQTSGGPITISANSLYISNTSTVNATSAGTVTIQPNGSGRLINLGTGSDTDTTLRLSQTEINQITAGTLVIGSYTAGNISITSPIKWPSNLTLQTGGFITGRALLTVNGTLLPAFTPIVVTNANDSGSGSLRAAVAAASTNPGEDQITFDTSLTGSTITLLTPLEINDSIGGDLILTGPGASNLTISGGESSGILLVYSPSYISGLKLANGTGSFGTSPSLQGGAIYSNATMYLWNMVVSNCSANFGGAIYTSGSSLNLTSSNIANSIDFAGSSDLTLSDLILGSNLTATNANTISLGNITVSGQLNVAGNTATGSLSVNGSISATGTSSISLAGRNIIGTANIITQAGDISLVANDGNYQEGSFDGVLIDGSAVNVNTTGGNIVFNGRAASGSDGVGVKLNYSHVNAAGAGNVTITGVSGNGSSYSRNYAGVDFIGACVTTGSGALILNGISNSARYYSKGVYLRNSVNVASTGSGNVTITGTAATGTVYASGVYIRNSACVTANSGSLTINGTSCGTSCYSRGVFLNSSANISSTGSGNVTITGTASTGTKYASGVYIRNSSCVTADSGSLTINGTSCGTSYYSKGVFLNSYANISSTGSGKVTITGTAATGTMYASGVYIQNSACVTSNSGSLTINGTSCGTSYYSRGLFLNSSANISSTGTGNVTITGTAANGTNHACGIYVGNACVTTSSGELTVNGTSCGTGDDSRGISISGSNILATGAGNVTITGTAANGANYAIGILLYDHSNVTSSSGSITVNGTSCGTGTDSVGIVLDLVSNISATAAGNVTIAASTRNLSTGIGFNSRDSVSKVYANGGLIAFTANSLSLAGTVNATSAGNVLIQTFGAGVELGGAGDPTTLGLSSGEIGRITANKLTIGNGTTGNIAIVDAITFGNLTFVTGGQIDETGAGNLTVAGTANFVAVGNVNLSNSTNNFGTVTASGTNITVNELNSITIGAITASGDFTLQGDNTTSCISVTGPINATGGSGNVSLTGRNIVVTGNISTAAGGIRLIGNNRTFQTGSFEGVCISGSTVNVNTTSGNITIDGRGGVTTVNAGVSLDSSKVQAGGSGCVTITGVSGNGTNNAYGIRATGATVTTDSGSLTVNGTSCGTGADSRGVYLFNNANISATGAGHVTITGTAANGTSSACGILVNSSCVTTTSGLLTVNGTSCGTGTNSRGVFLRASTISGKVTINGTAANGTDYAEGIRLDSTNVTTSSDSLTFNGSSCGGNEQNWLFRTFG